MTLELVSIFDSATQSYGRPIFVPHVGQAVRSFTDEVRRQEGDLAMHQADFELFHLGAFDERYGTFKLFDVPESLRRGADITK